MRERGFERVRKREKEEGKNTIMDIYTRHSKVFPFLVMYHMEFCVLALIFSRT